MINHLLALFALNPVDYQAVPFGSGLINHTWKLNGTTDSYILQQINKRIFKNPQAIADNLRAIDQHLKSTAPDYLFPAPLPVANGDYLIEFAGEFFRLLPFIPNSHSVDTVTRTKQAFEAAKQFGKFSRLLNGFDISQLKYTLPDFHNLDLRYQQFQAALQNAPTQQLTQVDAEIKAIEQNANIVHTYQQLTGNQQMPLRVIHHDTKINNVLFDDGDNGLCVIDLDTVMPGYFISDAGDMMRTYLSPANEEEQDLSLIEINTDYFAAIYRGYMGEMGDILTDFEKSLFIYSGKMMMYMQALRFLTDFLNGDVYYQTKYPGHNLARARNQLTLLQRYIQAEPVFNQIIQSATAEIKQLL